MGMDFDLVCVVQCERPECFQDAAKSTPLPRDPEWDGVSHLLAKLQDGQFRSADGAVTFSAYFGARDFDPDETWELMDGLWPHVFALCHAERVNMWLDLDGEGWDLAEISAQEMTSGEGLTSLAGGLSRRSQRIDGWQGEQCTPEPPAHAAIIHLRAANGGSLPTLAELNPDADASLGAFFEAIEHADAEPGQLVVHYLADPAATLSALEGLDFGWGGVVWTHQQGTDGEPHLAKYRNGKVDRFKTIVTIR